MGTKQAIVDLLKGCISRCSKIEGGFQDGMKIKAGGDSLGEFAILNEKISCFTCYGLNSNV